MASSSANTGYTLVDSNVPPAPLLYLCKTDNISDDTKPCYGCFPIYGSIRGLGTINIASTVNRGLLMPGYFLEKYTSTNYAGTKTTNDNTTSNKSLALSVSIASSRLYLNNNSTNEIKNSFS